MATTSLPNPTPTSTTAPTKTDKAFSEAPTNPRGIPLAPFVDKVEDYVSSRSEVEETLKRFQEMIQKYQFMEQNTSRRLQGLHEKIPDIRSTLEMVQYLQARKSSSTAPEPLKTTFSLSETLYAHAEVPVGEEVYLWLGANVMLSYPLGEAVELLGEKLKGAEGKVGECEEDGSFLREQITTLEVATARVYNWDVTQRRKEKEAGGSGDATKGGGGDDAATTKA